MGEDIMLDSSAPIEAGAPLDGPDMAKSAIPGPEKACLLFRAAPEGDVVSSWVDGPTADAVAREGEVLVASRLCLSPRLDIWRRRRERGAHVLDIYNTKI